MRNNNQIFISISLVIYNYKEKDFIDLIVSLSKSIAFLIENIDAKVILYIIDNNEKKSSEEIIKSKLKDLGYKYKNVYIKTYDNEGYGHAHNLIINNDNVKSDYHIVCNPDIIFFEDTLYEAIKFLEVKNNSEVALLTPAIYDEDKILQKMCKRNPTFMRVFARRFPIPFMKKKLYRFAQQYEYADKDYTKEIVNVEFCTGCFMVFRTKVLKFIKGFDERFFMYFEDADITRKVLVRGYETMYLPEFKVIHKWERANKTSKKFTIIAIKSAFKYFWKWK
ncbi:hypothetical protein B4919_02885 [Francisella tularensis subsp. novicida]|uniref:glycosyltransferase n=1 Tax=Francisella tularensis TaxID=263 RepID=UPI000CE29735|nr:glycosyltransferase family 2 protein [Francisella tularensis]AVC43798.1 hypothetical protein B4919_02885 [Francisella tularensis subsp. novicida]